MPSAWESESGKDECWSDREAWRGELHLDGSDSWRREAGEGWVWAGDDGDLIGLDLSELDPAPEDTWPEDLAGPEYWLFKRFGM